jgi:hypothetical protein
MPFPILSLSCAATKAQATAAKAQEQRKESRHLDEDHCA